MVFVGLAQKGSQNVQNFHEQTSKGLVGVINAAGNCNLCEMDNEDEFTFCQQCQSSSLLWNEVPKNTASKRQGKVDFLSFNVTDKSSPKLSSELSRPVALGGTGDSVKKIQ
ncbi:hypothetical protein CFP56_034395 [Quercus suber]|uniref:Uncharacterized protein n=1 Tax=Quercus suber TaxID=58331 RepID=A0AAW0JC90_QUESU